MPDKRVKQEKKPPRDQEGHSWVAEEFDDVLRRMLETPPKPKHQQKVKKKPPSG